MHQNDPDDPQGPRECTKPKQINPRAHGNALKAPYYLKGVREFAERTSGRTGMDRTHRTTLRIGQTRANEPDDTQGARESTGRT